MSTPSCGIAEGRRRPAHIKTRNRFHIFVENPTTFVDANVVTKMRGIGANSPQNMGEKQAV